MSCHESKTALDSGFRAMISRFQLLDSGSFFIRYWIPYSRLLELHSGFQIPPAKISLPQAPEFPDFGSCERGENKFWQVASIWLRCSGVHFTTIIVSSPPYYQDSKWKIFTSFLQSNPVNTQALREPWNSKVSVNGVSVLSGLNLEKTDVGAFFPKGQSKLSVIMRCP